ncbi:MAG: type IV secretion system DNA-binding domain-containing protein [Mucilaginibacter sp.]
MKESVAQALTRQFYEWENIGRGWHKAAFAVDLEPPFVPFFGHFIGGEIIDDGKSPTWLSSLFNPPKPTNPNTHKETIEAYPFSDTSLLSAFSITLPRHFKHNRERIEQVLIMLSYRKSPISFEIIGSADIISLQFVCREPDAEFLQTQLQAFFPECGVVSLGFENDALLVALQNELALYTVDFGLSEEFMRPLAMYPNGDNDPYTAVFGVLSRLREDEHVVLQILFSGTHNAWAESIMTAVCDDSGKQSFFLDAPEMPQLAKEKTAHPLYGVSIRTATLAETVQQAAVLLQHVSTALVHASNGSNSLMPLANAQYTVDERLHDIVWRESHRVGMLLNSRELATFVHFPSATLSKKLLGVNKMTKRAPDFLIDEPYCLGINGHQGIEEHVGIDTVQRLRHAHVIGATGTGKSTLLHSLIMQDIHGGGGLCVIDPHGDLVEAILANVPEKRIHDVVLIDPSDSVYPVGFNILSAHSDLEKELLASDLVALFRRFSTSWGDQMNSVFANAISAFVYNSKGGHLGDLRKFLIEQPFRNQFLATCTDPDIVYYWQKEYPLLKSSSLGSILTRLDSFLRPKVIRNMVCQGRSLDFQELMDGKKIVLVKLSQGLLGEENSHLLGAFIVAKLQQTAMARQAQDAQQRVPFFCYIDEFQHFVTPSMASILSGARKYSLGLILAHQDMQQVARVDADIASSVLANAGTRVCFRLGDTDAKRMQEGLSAFTVEDLQTLSTGEAVARVNTRDQDFNILVLPYEGGEQQEWREAIVTHSRATYAVPIAPPAQSEPARDPIAPEPKVSPSPITEPLPIIGKPLQKELTEHRYLQMFIKKQAEAYGYRSGIEVPTPDGKGVVDILLEKDGTKIAIEISVTTTAAWELHNIQKCLAAGYATVAVCATSPSKIAQIQSIAQNSLTGEELARVHVIAPDNIHTLFAKNEPKKEKDSTMKGYRVKVRYEQSGGNSKNEIIQRIMNEPKPG